MKNKATASVLVFLLLAGFAGVWRLQVRIDGEKSAVHIRADELALRSGKVLQVLSLEYAPLMGAIYWTRAVQYFGEQHRLHRTNLDLLWPLLDIATTLDPHLMPAYRFGSIFLSDHAPRGAGRPDLAVKLLERGIQANPDQWRLYQDLGNVYYFDAKDYTKASQAFAEGGKNPNAFVWMKVMAAKIAGEGESPETSYFLWSQVYSSTADLQIKKNAAEHMELMRAQLELKQIDQMAKEYRKKTGRHPKSIAELVEAGLLHGIPKDPEGYPYELGENGKAEVNLNSPMLEKQLMEEQAAK